MKRALKGLFLAVLTITAGLPALQASGESITQPLYTPADAKEVRQVLDTYGAIPGGITLEGTAAGFPAVQNAVYDRSQNTFILNEQIRYMPPVSPAELQEIALAVQKEDRLGFGFQREAKVYGALEPAGLVARTLQSADMALGRRILGLPAPEKEKGTSVLFRLENYRFSVVSGFLRPESSDINIMLVPVLSGTDANGNFLPDFEALKSGMFAVDYLGRAQGLVEYIKTRNEFGSVAKAVRYGEVAAFLRSLKLQQAVIETSA